MDLNDYNFKKRYFQSPVTINIELTTKCPLKCPQCFISNDKPTDMPLDLALDIINQVNSLKIINILLSGGDPLQYPYLLDVIKHIKGYSALSTSGIGLNKDTAKKLKQLGLGCCYVSLNGSTEQIHNISRDCFSNAIDAINNLVGEKQNCRINWVARRDNIEDFNNMISLCNDLGVGGIDILMPKVLAKGDNSSNLEYSMLCSLADTIIANKNNIDISIENCFIHLRKLVNPSKINVVNNGCMAGKMSMAIDVNGRFFPCPHLHMYKETALTIKEYWDDSKWLNLLRSNKRLQGNTCSICTNQNKCNMCYATSLETLYDFTKGVAECKFLERN